MMNNDKKFLINETALEDAITASKAVVAGLEGFSSHVVGLSKCWETIKNTQSLVLLGLANIFPSTQTKQQDSDERMVPNNNVSCRNQSDQPDSKPEDKPLVDGQLQESPEIFFKNGVPGRTNVNAIAKLYLDNTISGMKINKLLAKRGLQAKGDFITYSNCWYPIEIETKKIESANCCFAPLYHFKGRRICWNVKFVVSIIKEELGVEPTRG